MRATSKHGPQMCTVAAGCSCVRFARAKPVYLGTAMQLFSEC